MTSPSVPRREARAKISGTAQYIADISIPGEMWGVTVRSECVSGRIAAIDFSPSIPWNEFVVATAADIPGHNSIAHILEDQPCLAGTVVNHWGEPILLIAHPDRYQAEEARRGVSIRYEPTEPVLDMEQSSRLFKEYRREQGDVDQVFASGGVVTEEVYHTPAVDQVYIEPQGMLAVASPAEGVTVRGSLQCPFYVHHALQRLLNLPPDKVRVIACETGGGFGGKEDYPSVLACHAALLAWKSGRPVKMIYSRGEDLAATTKRHPSRTRIRSAFSAGGQLEAIDIDFLIDGGAYTTLSPVVLSRGLIHATGPYYCPNIRLHGRAVATNHPPHGAFRGFGVPQTCFAMERHMDLAAARLGIRPDELRRRNLFRAGQRTATGQTLRPDLDLTSLLDRAVEVSDYTAKQTRFEKENAGAVIRRGIGLSCSFHGTGFTGAGERVLDSEVVVEAVSNDRLRVFCSSVEMGQGSATVLAQIAAGAFGCPIENVELIEPDTSVVPNSGPTVASRTTAVVGELIRQCARELRNRFPLQTRARAHYEPPEGLAWDEASFSGDAYADYSWAVQVAEVSVDTDTGETKVDHVTAVVDAGHIVNAGLARGQVEGGIVQGVGFALTEETLYRDGRIQNAQMTNTIIPTSQDAPRMDVIFAEPPPGSAAKGLGELSLDGAAPAIVNAVAHAAGGLLDTLPASAERVLEAMHA